MNIFTVRTDLDDITDPNSIRYILDDPTNGINNRPQFNNEFAFVNFDISQIPMLNTVRLTRELRVTKNVIFNEGGDYITILRDDISSFSVFNITNDRREINTVKLYKLIIENGFIDSEPNKGAGITNESQLYLYDCTLRNNYNEYNDPNFERFAVGGILNFRTLIVDTCLFQNNYYEFNNYADDVLSIGYSILKNISLSKDSPRLVVSDNRFACFQGSMLVSDSVFDNIPISTRLLYQFLFTSFFDVFGVELINCKFLNLRFNYRRLLRVFEIKNCCFENIEIDSNDEDIGVIIAKNIEKCQFKNIKIFNNFNIIFRFIDSLDIINCSFENIDFLLDINNNIGAVLIYESLNITNCSFENINFFRIDNITFGRLIEEALNITNCSFKNISSNDSLNRISIIFDCNREYQIIFLKNCSFQNINCVIFLLDREIKFKLINVTIIDTSGPIFLFEDFEFNDYLNIIILNCTITGNTGKLFVYPNDSQELQRRINTFIANTIISGNADDFNVATGSLGNNLISSISDFNRGSFKEILNDQFGTVANPLDPLLMDPTECDCNGTTIRRLMSNSPCINAGNNLFVESFEIEEDQCCNPRILNGVVDIGAAEFYVVCYSGDSLVFSQNKITREIKELKVKEIYSNEHQVYNTEEQKFIDIKLNIVMGPSTTFMKIEKDSIDPKKPSEDYYITPGHHVKINGNIMTAEKVSGAKKIETKPQMVYSIITKKSCPIRINNIETMTWGYNKWMKMTKEKGIHWVDNKKI